MTKEEREKWEKDHNELIFNPLQRDMYNKLKEGKGWLY